MTECSPISLHAKAPGRRIFDVRFDGGDITSDAGALLLGLVEERRRILHRFAGCFRDYRDPARIEHTVEELVAQRVYAIALGHEDVNDHDTLRLDPLLAALVGKADPKGAKRSRTRDEGKGLAASSTLHRLELAHPDIAPDDRYKRIALEGGEVDDLLVTLFLEAHEAAPAEVILDFDATDDRIHGKQQGRFYHGYYDGYCYLPLYVFAGDHLLGARLRTADRDGADGTLDELERIVPRIREAWPETRIIVRGDSGFCREWLMRWCEEQNVEYVLGMAKNDRLVRELEDELEEVRLITERTDKASRLFKGFTYRTEKSWSRTRRLVGKAEQLVGRSNPRFVVTSLDESTWPARELYEKLYCARGEMENRIKEQQLDLFADRTSCWSMRANQTRLYLSSMAYVLLSELRRLGLAGTELARAQCGTIRTRLLKIGARVRVTVRRIWISMSEGFPLQDLFAEVWSRLRST